MGGLFDKISGKAKKAAATPEAEPEETATPEPEETKKSSSGGLSAKFGKLQKDSKGSKVALAGNAKPTSTAKAGAMNAAIAKKKKEKGNDGINPPEQHENPPSNDAAPESDAEKKKRVAAEKRAAKKTEKAAAGAAKKAATEPALENDAGMTVFIDCLPVKGVTGAKQLVDILAPSMALVAEKISEPHWNLIDFGKGPALLATAFDEWLDDNPVNGVVFVDGASDESRAVREVLISHAKHVVKGMR